MEQVTPTDSLWAQYVSAFSKAENNSWTKGYWKELVTLYEQTNVGFPEKFILIHPNWYKHLNTQNKNTCPIRNSFGFKMDLQNERCQSEIYWGYECPLSAEKFPLHRDHIFPFALGGPSVPVNCIALCAWHNQLKDCDPHVMPRPEEKPDWFDATLKAVRDRLR